MTSACSINGGDVLMSGGFFREPLQIYNGKVTKETSGGESEYDASGCWVLPGIIDVHGDAFEGILQPRPGVWIRSDIAYKEADRQMLSNGITTAFHALTVSWEPGSRSIENARKLITDLEAVHAHLVCSTHLNIRWETFAVDHVDEVLSWLENRPGDILSINDHTTANHSVDQQSPKLARWAARMHLTPAETLTLIADVWARRGEVPAATRKICLEAGKMGRAIMSHDEVTVEDYHTNREMGITVSEFPTTEEAAQAARDANEHVILGAPNALRGGSHNNALCATSAIQKKLCTVLASDYYYPAPFHAVFRLVDEEILSLEESWKLISKNAAESVGLCDRGELSEGKRADIVIVDKKTRAIQAVFVNGQRVFHRT